MGKKILTVLIILGVAAFIYYNKGSFLDKIRMRKDLEHRIEDLTGLDVNLKDFFKGMEGLNRDISRLDDDKLKDIRDRLDSLTSDEREALSRLLDEKGEDLETFLNDVIADVGDDVTKGDKP